MYVHRYIGTNTIRAWQKKVGEKEKREKEKAVVARLSRQNPTPPFPLIFDLAIGQSISQ
jgi:hypothetical protein